MKEKKSQKFSVDKYKPSDIKKFRDYYLKEEFDLIDITHLCTFKLGNSGWCNEFNEPDENIYHIQCWYRQEQIATFYSSHSHVLDEDKYVIYSDDDEDDDEYGPNFIIFRLVGIKK